MTPQDVFCYCLWSVAAGATLIGFPLGVLFAGAL